jgi:hypothetical protein
MPKLKMISRSTITLLNSNQQGRKLASRIATVFSLVDNQLAYPTITIIDHYSILFQQQSYLKRKTLFLSLKK